MKRDGRKLDHKTLEEIRRMAVQRVWEGEDPSEVMESYGFCRTTIYKWLRAAEGKRRGLDALRSRKATGRPPKLTKSQQRQVFRWVNGKDPRQYGFDFGLWTRKVVAELVSEKFDIKLSLASIGKVLATVGLRHRSRSLVPMSVTQRRSRLGSVRPIQALPQRPKARTPRL